MVMLQSKKPAYAGLLRATLLSGSLGCFVNLDISQLAASALSDLQAA